MTKNCFEFNIALRELKSEDNSDLFLRFEGNGAQRVRSKGESKGQTLNAVYFGVIKCLLARIRRVRPEHRKKRKFGHVVR